MPDDRPVDLARVSQYVATMQGSGPLYDELHAASRLLSSPARFIASSRGFRRSSASAARRTS